MTTTTTQTPTPPLTDYINALISEWYECAPYGEQIPNDLPQLLKEFCNRYGNLDAAEILIAFEEAEPDDPILNLFECIFSEAAHFTITGLSNAVFDGNEEVLKLIDAKPIAQLERELSAVTKERDELKFVFDHNRKGMDKAQTMLDGGRWGGFPLIEGVTTELEETRAALTAAQEDNRRLRQFIESISKQKPEKPDHFTGCSQCERNISDAEDLINPVCSRCNGWQTEQSESGEPITAA